MSGAPSDGASRDLQPSTRPGCALMYHSLFLMIYSSAQQPGQLTPAGSASMQLVPPSWALWKGKIK
eukprot:scaffold10537_cov122-Isochrysis_galbana.AAC.16